MNLDNGWCTVGPIPVGSGEAGSDDGKHVYLRSITSFFNLPGLYWVYEGKVLNSINFLFYLRIKQKCGAYVYDYEKGAGGAPCPPKIANVSNSGNIEAIFGQNLAKFRVECRQRFGQ